MKSEPSSPAKLWEEYKEISGLVEKVRDMEGVEVADYGASGLGLKVSRDLKEGEEVIRIP